MLTPKTKNCFSNNCSEFTIKEATGIYSPSANSGGWGNPNNVFSDFTGIDDIASLSIINPTSSTPVNFDIKQALNNAVLPNAYFEGFTFPLLTLSPSDLNISTGKFPDGVYTINLQYIQDGGNTINATFKVLNTCNIECCLQKMFIKAFEELKCGKCNLCETFADYFKAKAVFQQAVHYAHSLHDFATATELLKQAEKFCNFNNCKC
jgi:hypothetical protein